MRAKLSTEPQKGFRSAPSRSSISARCSPPTGRRQPRLSKPSDHACRNIGFFYIANHGVSQALIDRVYAESKRFFGLPKAEKMKVHFKNVDRFGRGYVALGDAQSDHEVQADVHETFEIMLETPADDPDYLAGVKMYGPNQWPKPCPDSVTTSTRITRRSSD